MAKIRPPSEGAYVAAARRWVRLFVQRLQDAGYASGVSLPAKAVAVAAGMAMLTVALVGCGGASGLAVNGPLGGAARAPGDGATICARVGQPVTFGVDEYTNDGHRTLVLDHVGLLDPRGMRLIGVYAVPGVGLLVGVGLGWPPRVEGRIPYRWRYRKPVRGYRLAPGRQVNVVVGVVATAMPRGRTPGLVIDYHDPAGRYVVNDHVAIIIITRRHCM
jgi:hypothetical protein